MRSTETVTIVQPRVELADPHVSGDNKDRLSVLAAIYEPLVARDAGGAFRPLLAESWRLADDARSWTFALRQGVRFHNGAALTAEDVVASFARICDPSMGGELGTQGVYRGYLASAAISALDRRTLRIVTAEPMADLLDVLVELPIAPADKLGELPSTPVGSGPYRVVERDAGRIELTAFAEHWGGPPPLSGLVWRAEPDPEARAEALLGGSADLAAAPDPHAARQIAADPRARLITHPGSTCIILMCRASDGPCADRRVRQALNYAADVPALIDQLRPGSTPSNGPLTPLHFGYDPETPPYPHDPALARNLLAEAGYGAGLRLTLDVPAKLPDEAVQLAAMLRTQYAEAGIDLAVRVFEDRPAYAEMVRAKQIGDLCCFDSSPLSTYRTLREKLHGGARGPWWQGYANPEVDGLLDAAQTTVDLELRRGQYRRAYRLIRDDAPWVFLYSTTLAWGAGHRLRGWHPSLDGVIRMSRDELRET